MNPFSELKRKLTPRSRWGAVNLAPRREFGGLTWSDAEQRRQPQDGALINSDFVADEPEVSPLRKPTFQAKADVPAAPTDSKLRKQVFVPVR